MSRILVVEDDRSIRKFIEVILQREGYEVASAATVAEAFSVAGPFDLLILDIHLPDGDGRLVMKLFPSAPAIVMSGFTEPDVKLSKPFTQKDLIHTVLRELSPTTVK